MAKCIRINIESANELDKFDAASTKLKAEFSKQNRTVDSFYRKVITGATPSVVPSFLRLFLGALSGPSSLRILTDTCFLLQQFLCFS